MNAFLDSVARLLSEPSSNLTAAAVGMAILVLAVLIVVIALLLYVISPIPSRRSSQGAPQRTDTSQQAPAPTKRDRRIELLVWLGGSLLVLVALFVSTGTNTYCADVCHSMTPWADTWEASSHASASCITCHESVPGPGIMASAAARVQDVAATTLPNSASIRPLVPADACLSCHDGIESGPIETDTGIRVAHEHFIADGATCTSCHGNMGHAARSPLPASSTMSECLRCHDDDTTSAECDVCHLGDPGATPVVERKSVRVDMPSPTCGGCHQQETCDACHGIRMPHTDDFSDPREHARSAAFAEGKRLCYGCHVTSDCNACHVAFDAHGVDWPARHAQYSFSDGNGYCLWCHKTEDYCTICHER